MKQSTRIEEQEMNNEERREQFERLKVQLQNCREYRQQIKDEPRPVFQGNLDSKIFQISQAPSRRVMETGLPFNDASGKKLKQEWYQITDAEFLHNGIPLCLGKFAMQRIGIVTFLHQFVCNFLSLFTGTAENDTVYLWVVIDDTL